ncbi:MAG: type II toxin-antitoxin system PemK/MazF family toxin [Minisyncoccales bacterium]
MAEKQLIVKRGEVYVVNFDPVIGSEINKSRPALVLQNNIANHYSPVTIVAAISSSFDDCIYPTEVLINSPEGGLSENSVVLLNQIRSIDKRRIIKRLGVLNSKTMENVDKAIAISLDIF